MLVDTGWRPDPPPEPDPAPRRRPEVPWRALAWTALVVVLFVAGLLTAGWPSVGLVYAALLVSFWRGSRMLTPHAGTMRDYSQ